MHYQSNRCSKMIIETQEQVTEVVLSELQRIKDPSS